MFDAAEVFNTLVRYQTVTVRALLPPDTDSVNDKDSVEGFRENSDTSVAAGHLPISHSHPMSKGESPMLHQLLTLLPQFSEVTGCREAIC